jgi:hypothetical protein
MLIPIDEKYALGADKHAWFIAEQVKKKRNGEVRTEWKQISWHANAEQAIRHFVDARLRCSNASTLAELVENQQRILDSIGQALTPQIDVRVA